MLESGFQTLFNAAVGISGAIVGWLFNNLWQEHKELVKADAKLADKVNAIEVIVAGTYVRRDELIGYMRDMGAKLDRIEEKLNGKADK
jgi:hypothetical protein